MDTNTNHLVNPLAIDVETLRLDAVKTIPVDFDWSKDRAMEAGWRAFAAAECECGEMIVVEPPGGDATHADLDDDSDCEGWVEHASEPMMSYYYPVGITHTSMEQAARDICMLPLVIIEFEDGSTGLALTGGGMDLTWEICEAFVRLRMLPPLHFCDLPERADKIRDPYWRTIVSACKRTTDLAAMWAQGTRERLDDLEARLQAESEGGVD